MTYNNYVYQSKYLHTFCVGDRKFPLDARADDMPDFTEKCTQWPYELKPPPLIRAITIYTYHIPHVPPTYHSVDLDSTNFIV